MASNDYYQFDPNSRILTAAMDLGTTYSGYGFAFKHQPDKVIANKNWGEDIGTSSYKAPTSVLINKKQEFVAFGYRAEYDYSRFCDEGKGEEYDLFKNFKMMLYNNQNLCRTATLTSTTGTEAYAIDIFAMALKYIKNHLLEELNRQTASIPDENQIQWVLTIPAIWNDEAKQFMREAAFHANLIKTKYSKQLMFALEPEAASVYCRSDFTSQLGVESTSVDFKPGTRYMIVDAGGGTVDITAHEIEESGDMIELICATGGNWGGKEVDKNFENYITDILGQDFIDVYKRDFPSQWLNIMNDFEKKKRVTNIDYEQEPGISISMPYSIAQKYKDETGGDIEETLKNASAKGLVFKHGNIIMNGETVLGFFKNILDNIVNHIRETLEKEDLEILQYMVLVGGFSESKFLFHRLKDEFSSVCKVISPQSANLSIIKGAVMFGYKPQIIAARRSRKTYGCCVDGPFIYSKHNPERVYTDIYGNLRCRGLFEEIARKGESVSLYHCKVLNFHTDNFTEVEAGTQIYATDRTDVMYADEHGLTKIGRIKIDVSENRESRINIQIRVYFGRTEIVIETENKNVDDVDIIISSIDFLDD